MENKFKKIFLLFHILNPKYSSMIINKIKIFLYTKFGSNDKNIYDKLNTKYCISYYKFFKKCLSTNNSQTNYLNNSSIVPLSNVVFVFWHSGIDNMPRIVKTCYYNLVNTTRYKVILLDKNNIRKYSNIPDLVYKWLNDNVISITTFSDILRLNLLSIHNAIWLDSTCFLYKDFPVNIFETTFLTIYPSKGESIFNNIPKFYYAPDLHVQQNYFLVGTNKYIFKIWYNLLVSYILNETRTLRNFRPYYITYYVFEYLYANDDIIKKHADNRIVNNRLVETIEGHNDIVYNENDYSKYFDDTTYIYKLSYKMTFKPYINGVLTPFGKLLKLKGIAIDG